MPSVVTCKSASLPDDVRSKLQELDSDLDGGEITKKGYCNKMWKLLKPHLGDSITDQYQCLLSRLESTKLKEEEFYSEMMRFLDLNCRSKKKDDGIQFGNKKMNDGAHSDDKKRDDGTQSSDKMDSSTHCDGKNVDDGTQSGDKLDDGTHSGDKMDVDTISDHNKIDDGTLSDESVDDKESENGKNGSSTVIYETVAGTSKSRSPAGSAKKKLAVFKALPKTTNNNKASLKGPNNTYKTPYNAKASPKTPNNTPTNTKGRQSGGKESKNGTQLTVYSMLMKNPDKRKVVPQTFDDMENEDCESHPDKKPKLENSAVQEEQQIKIPKLEDCAAPEEKPAVEIENERKVKSKKPMPGKCDICHQLLEDTDLRLYQGHPQDAVEEYVALTDPRLNLFNGTEEEVHESDQHPHNKITHFSVYDKAGHLCPFDSGLIERNVLLYFSGYMKAIYEESPDIEGGIPTKDMGPINEWWVSGFDGGERAVVGFSTAYGEYYLMEPSESYAPIMETVREKIYMGKVVIEFLLDEINPTYEDLINKLQTTVPPRGIASLTEDGLLRHAQFICDQVLSFDSADESQNLLITTSCMRALVKLAGVTFGKRRAMRRQDKKDFKRGKAAQWSKATTTQLVSDVFEAFFTEQLDKNQNEQDKGPRRKRCGVCEACQYPDCGTCIACQDMLKFGGTGRSKQACAKRRCPNMAIQEADDSDPEDDDTVLAEGGEQLSNGSLTTAVQRDYKVKCGEVKKKVDWVGKTIHDDGRKAYYKSAIVGTEEISVGDCVMVESNNPSTPHYVGRVVYMWQDKSKDKYFHAHWFCRGSDTMLGETSDSQELFLVDECENCLLSAVSRTATVEFRATPENWAELGEERSNKQEAVIDDAKTFFYQKRYDSFHGRFEDPLPDVLCLKEDAQHRFCMSCERISQKRKHEAPYVDDKIDVEDQKNQKHYGVVHWRGVEYRAGTCVFLAPTAFKFKHCEANSAPNRKDSSKKSKADEEMFPEFYRKHSDHVKGSNANTPQPFCIGYIKTIFTNSKEKLVTAGDICIKVTKLYRPENTHKPASLSQQVDLNMLYWSDEEVIMNFSDVTGRCYIVFSENLTESISEWSNAGPNRFYFSQAYNAAKKEFTDPPKDATMIGTLGKGKGKGKGKSSAKVEPKSKTETPETWRPVSKRLRSLDVFAGCGGLSEGLHQSGIAESHWAIEKEEPAAHAFRLNNPECTVFTEDCNHLLKQVMNGLKTNDKGQVLPRKGEVELLCGGPPCQGFSGMNRFNSRQYSLFKNSLIVSYLSYCDYFRPRFFILENVRNFVSFKRSMVLKLTVRCLVKMGYQVTFGVLQAGNYGVPQTRRRAIIIAAAPGEVLPSYPEPKHVFNPRATHLTVMVDDKKFASNCKWVESAPYRTITVRDAMCDLPEIRNGANSEEMSYGGDPLSHFQRTMRGLQYQPLLRDHICKEMAPMVEARIAQIPTCMGSDWRDLPNLLVRLSDGTFSKKLLYTHHDKKNGKSSTGALRGVCSCATGKPCDPMDRQYNTLIPWCLPHTGNRHNHWAGLYGRLEWDGFFSTTVTNPEPMGKQGRVLHPEQTRVVSVRECARSQGFPDTYRFFGSILDKHRQIGNAVPPPMGAAIGWEIRKCVNK